MHVDGWFYSNDPVDAVSHLSNAEGIKGFNRYSYAANNPYKYVDPDGNQVIPITPPPPPPPLPSNTGIQGGSGTSFPIHVIGDSGSRTDGRTDRDGNLIFNESTEDEGVTIDDDGSGAVEITVGTKKGNVTIIGEVSIDGETLTIGGENGAHIDGPGGSSLGLSGIKEAGRKIGKEYAVGQVVIQGGVRTTGANPGKSPIPIKIKVYQ